jgi:hypothetical protein
MADIKNEGMDEFLSDEAPEEAAPEEAPAEEEQAAAPEPAEESAPAEPAPAEEPEERAGKYVPIQALDEERHLRKELEGKVAAMNDRFSEVVARLNQPPQPPAPEAPSFEDDPAGHLKQRVDDLAQTKEQLTQQQEYSRQIGQANNAILAAEQAFAQNNPDYQMAVQHVAGMMFKNAQIYGSDPVAAMAQVRQELFDSAIKAMASDRDPASTLYERAKLMGYEKPSSATPPEKQAAQLRTVQAGQEANRSLSEGGAGKTAPEMTLEALANMDPDDFDKNWDKIVGNASRGKGSGLSGIFKS